MDDSANPPRRTAHRAWRHRRCTWFVAAVVAVVVAASCAPPPETVPGPDQPRSCVPRIGTSQIILPLPGLWLPLPSIKGISEFDDLAAAPAALHLPTEVDLRDNTQGFNSFAEFALADGSLFTRPRSSAATWRKVPTPDCLDGHIASVSVDSNMAVALDADGWIYSLDNLLSGPLLWNWTRSYGAPIWLWPGMKVPQEARSSGKWAISHRMSSSFVDAKGYEHPLTAGLVQLVSLTGDGSRIVFQDPWLPPDYSYEIGGPVGGRFISTAISGSGSVTFVMNRFGDMYTRKYDLDLAGANHIPSRYTWQDQGALPTAPNQLEERFDESYAAISLPAEDWQHQPKIPGEVTARISISQTGPALEDRELRVEGRQDGNSGYWTKPLTAGQWRFVANSTALASPILTDADPGVDQSTVELAPVSPLHFEGALGGGWTARIDHFDWAQTRHDVTLSGPSGRSYPVTLYTTDGLRLAARGSGLDREPRWLEGALDVRGAERAGSAELAVFVRSTLEGRDVYEVWVQATTSELSISPARFVAQPIAVLRSGPR